MYCPFYCQMQRNAMALKDMNQELYLMNKWINEEQREPVSDKNIEFYKQKALIAIKKAKESAADWTYYNNLKQYSGLNPNLIYSIKQAEDTYNKAVKDFKDAKTNYEIAKQTAEAKKLKPKKE